MPGPQELIVIAIVALLFLGPEQLPEAARKAGELLARFRAETSRSMEELKRAAELDGLDRELRELQRDLRSTRDQVAQEFTRGADAARTRTDDRPPPFDPEAT